MLVGLGQKGNRTFIVTALRSWCECCRYAVARTRPGGDCIGQTWFINRQRLVERDCRPLIYGL